ncbi:MAG: hypothetical protein LH631_12425 [Alkalinema sp. CAN_BIN05]|nr:hypothetical protein [Alkalinema sp. CAN_BIN05]
MPFKLIWRFALLPIVLGLQTTVEAALPTAQQITALRQTIRQSGETEFTNFIQTHQISTDRLPNPDQRSALEQLCQQRDCHASRLYWYTDLEKAKAAAKTTGKPILSLRLLGNLNEELTCANSRFFRVALYPNAAISQTLRERFILHWSSERPVPKLTLDFGDGRKLQRTVTGNSIHYVLDSNGNPIEAIPGLYTPQAFLEQLNQIDRAFQTATKQSDQTRYWQTYHRDRLIQLQSQWAKNLKTIGLTQPPKLLDVASTDARTAGQIAVAKMAPERPLVRALRLANQNQTELITITDEASWQKLAALVPSQLDARSLGLMQTKLDPKNPNPNAIKQFEQRMAIDMVRNEYLLHAQIHQWMLIGNLDFDTLNQRVYSELFLTPKNDPWLGLNPQDAFAAIEKDGVIP